MVDRRTSKNVPVSTFDPDAYLVSVLNLGLRREDVGTDNILVVVVSDDIHIRMRIINDMRGPWQAFDKQGNELTTIAIRKPNDPCTYVCVPSGDSGYKCWKEC
jgi:hypothetical protein